MPYAIVKTHNGKFSLINSATGEVHSKGTTKKKAMAQMRLLEGIEHGKGIGASTSIPTGDKQTEMLEMMERRAEDAVNMVAKGFHTHHMEGEGGCRSNQVAHAPPPPPPQRMTLSNDEKRSVVNHIIKMLGDQRISNPRWMLVLSGNRTPQHLRFTKDEKTYIMNRILSEPNEDYLLDWYNRTIYRDTNHGSVEIPLDQLKEKLEENHNWVDMKQRFQNYKNDYKPINNKRKTEKTITTLSLKQNPIFPNAGGKEDKKPSGVIKHITDYL